MPVPKGKILIDIEDIIGKRLGKLEVVSYKGRRYDKTKGGDKLRHYYLCKCDCGGTNVVQRGPLVNEIVHSCGCERGRKHGNKNEK